MTIHRFFVYFLCLSLCLWYCLDFRFNGSMVSKQLPMRSEVRNTFNSLLRLMRMDRTNKKKKSNRQHIIIKSGLKFHLGERMTPYSIIGLLVLRSRAKKSMTEVGVRLTYLNSTCFHSTSNQLYSNHFMSFNIPYLFQNSTEQRFPLSLHSCPIRFYVLQQISYSNPY